MNWLDRQSSAEAMYLGLGLANLINLFTPDAIVLGGSIMKNANLFLPGIRETIRQGCRFVPFEKTELLLASLGEDANLIGAAMVWHHRFGNISGEHFVVATDWSQSRRQRALMARSKYMIVLVFLIFFVMSLLTNILGPILPDIISSFHVSLTAAGFLAFAFFIAYGVMSIPAGFLMERFHEKPVMVWSFVVSTLGALAFALVPNYSVAFASWFVIGAGMAVLQVVVNPLLRVAGGEEHYAFYSTLSQLVFGSASFISPRIYSYLVLNLSKSPVQGNGENICFALCAG